MQRNRKRSSLHGDSYRELYADDSSGKALWLSSSKHDQPLRPALPAMAVLGDKSAEWPGHAGMCCWGELAMILIAGRKD